MTSQEGFALRKEATKPGENKQTRQNLQRTQQLPLSSFSTIVSRLPGELGPRHPLQLIQTKGDHGQLRDIVLQACPVFLEALLPVGVCYSGHSMFTETLAQRAGSLKRVK